METASLDRLEASERGAHKTNQNRDTETETETEKEKERERETKRLRETDRETQLETEPRAEVLLHSAAVAAVHSRNRCSRRAAGCEARSVGLEKQKET